MQLLVSSRSHAGEELLLRARQGLRVPFGSLTACFMHGSCWILKRCVCEFLAGLSLQSSHADQILSDVGFSERQYGLLNSIVSSIIRMLGGTSASRSLLRLPCTALFRDWRLHRTRRSGGTISRMTRRNCLLLLKATASAALTARMGALGVTSRCPNTGPERTVAAPLPKQESA